MQGPTRRSPQTRWLPDLKQPLTRLLRARSTTTLQSPLRTLTTIDTLQGPSPSIWPSIEKGVRLPRFQANTHCYNATTLQRHVTTPQAIQYHHLSTTPSSDLTRSPSAVLRTSEHCTSDLLQPPVPSSPNLCPTLTPPPFLLPCCIASNAGLPRTSSLEGSVVKGGYC